MTNKKILILLFIIIISSPCLFSLGEGEKEGELYNDMTSGDLSSITIDEACIILPESFLRSYDPVTIFYKDQIGPPSGGPLDLPEEIISITPYHPGEYKWVDARILQFFPTIPWGPLDEYEIITRGVTKQLVTLMIPPQSVLPSSRTNLEPLDRITLTFDERIDPADLAEMISIEIKPLPGIGGQETLRLTRDDFTIKELDKTTSSGTSEYIVTLSSPIPYGKQAVLSLKLSLDPEIPGSVATYIFETKKEFTIIGMGSGSVQYPIATNGSIYSLEQAINCGTRRNPIYIEFSEDIAAPSVEIVKKLVRFSPAVRNLTYNTYGKRIMLYFDAERETPYQLTLTRADIKSRKGRPLANFGKTSFYFYYTQLDPFIQWTRGFALVEQYGPQFFPMQGRAMEKIDLRIYKIDPLNLNFWPYPSSPVVVDESRPPRMPGEEPEYGTETAEQIRLLGTPLISRVVPLPIDKSNPKSSFGIDVKPYLEEIAGKNQPGTYLLGYRELEGSAKRYYVKLTVTDISLSTIEEENGINFVVTSLQTGQPLSGAEVKLEGYIDKTWHTLIRGTTNREGQFYYQHDTEINYPVTRIVVTYKNDSLVLDPRNPPPQFMNNHWFSSSNSWFSWLRQKPVEKKAEAERKGFIITERPVYKPEETVYILGYIRIWQQGTIQKDGPRERKVIINGPGRKSWDFPIDLSSYGHFSLAFDKPNIPTGEYSVYLMDTKSGDTLAQTTFKKEAYRIPRFEINLSGPDKTPMDQPFYITLTADYYAGGRVVDQQVTWEVNRYGYQVRPPDFPGYLFSSDERFTSVRSGGSLGSYSANDMTDSNGSATLAIDPSKENTSVPLNYIIHATVRGADVQTVTSSTSVLALPPFVIGLKIGSLIKEDLAVTPEIIVIGHDEKPLKGKELSVKIFHREWHSYLTESDFTTGEAKYNSDIVDKLIFEKEYVSKDTPLQLSVPVTESGVYVVEVAGRDNLGRMQKVYTDCFVTGDTPITWKKTEAHIFETTLDKSSYSPGNTATLLLKSPFQNARALIIVEKPTTNEYHWIDIVNGQGLFTLPIEKNMIPRLPVHTLLIRGRIPGGDPAQVRFQDDKRKPIAMANTTWLYVEPDENKALITLDHPLKTEPGKTITMTINMKDVHGAPLDGAVSLWLVDRAVLVLGKEQFANPLYSFIGNVNSHIRIRETRNETVGNLVIEENPGGGGDEDEERGLIERTSIRRVFKTVPYFNDTIVVHNGTAVITIPMPDNLTDFAIRAIGISGPDKFGSAKSRIAVRLPLIIQSAMPRFVRPLDQFLAGGIGRVVEGDGGPGSFQVQARGMFIEKDGDLINEESGPLTWELLRPQPLYFPFRVPEDPEKPGETDVEITLAVKRNSDNASDGFTLKLPRQADISTNRIDLFSIVKPGEPVTLPGIEEPFRKNSVRRDLIITTEPALLSILNSMRFLSQYAHLCTEQRISKLYPGLALQNVFATFGLKEMFYPDKIYFDDLTAYLGSCLGDNGLYSFWPGSQGYVYLTAYVVEFLSLAKSAGFVFPSDLLDKPVQALKRALRSDYSNFISSYALRERIDALLALGSTGYSDEEYAQDLLVAAENSNIYEQGRILYFFIKNGYKTHKNTQKLLDIVKKRAVFKLNPQGKKVFEALQYSNTAWGGPVLSYEMQTFASVLRAFYAADPESEEVKLMTDYLLARSDADGWGNTSTNVAVLLTLGDIFAAPKSKGSNLDFTLTTGNQKKTISMKNKSLVLFEDTNGPGSTLDLVQKKVDVNPALFYSVEYVPSSPGNMITGINKGFVITREHLLYDKNNYLTAKNPVKANTEIPYTLEDVVEEHVQIINSQSAYYVAIRVPLATGFEPLNPALATAPVEAKPAGQFTREPSYSLYADDNVTFYFDQLPPGTFDFYFRVRAQFEGTFIQPPAACELMYDLSKRGRSDGTKIIIHPKVDGK
ncbi:MAG: hypothetical protein JXJ04_13165 [Spirochaetales bacterium]|nr:hypothetical protein [Spirochaetales bacterium]